MRRSECLRLAFASSTGKPNQPAAISLLSRGVSGSPLGGEMTDKVEHTKIDSPSDLSPGKTSKQVLKSCQCRERTPPRVGGAETSVGSAQGFHLRTPTGGLFTAVTEGWNERLCAVQIQTRSTRTTNIRTNCSLNALRRPEISQRLQRKLNPLK